MDNLQNFQTGYDPRRNTEGRPKKIYNILKKSGYTAEEIRLAFSELCWCTTSQAQEHVDNPESPLIVKVVAKAMIRGADKGDYRYISEIIQQVAGKPKETKDVKSEMDMNIRSVSVEVIASAIPVANSEADIID